MKHPGSLPTVVVSALVLVPPAAIAAESYPGYGYEPTAGEQIGEKEYSPYLNIGYLQRVFWGDTHLHTSYSTDAGMIGFEWTSSPDGNKLHRNVIFRDGKDEADQVIPFSNYDSTDPEDLWAWMQAYEDKTGGRALAIPHNGNPSNGQMFDDVTLTGMTVRVFAGWEFDASEVQRPDFAAAGYLRGVPMGSDLHDAPKGKAPTCMIRALRDVDGANLDRVQIVKG